MNYIKKYIILFSVFLFTNNVFAEQVNTSIIDIDSSNSNLLKIFLDKNIESDFRKIDGDIKLFKDLKSSNITKDLESNNIVNITLLNKLENNTSYSLLSVYGSEGTIDFKISNLIDGLEILSDGDTGINKINIINSNNIKVEFVNEIIGDEIDIKILKEYKLNGLKIDKSNNKILNLNLIDNLDIDSNYLIMLFSFNTSNGLKYIINNSIYDFSTKSILKEAVIDIKKEIKNENKTGNIALNSAETPDTGPETWILLLSTFLLSNFIYFKKRIK